MTVGRFAALVAVLALLGAGCAAGSAPGDAGPPPVRFAAVDLPAGVHPEVLAAAGDDLLVGVRRDGADVLPGLLRRAPDGTTTEVPAAVATPYGRTAAWYSLAADGERVVGVGGDRGGAHGNVRWSVWSGSPTGVAEQVQAFSTFGGWGAGELIDAVLTPAGPVLVGSWESARAGLDVAVWTADGSTWNRSGSAGTPLESSATALGFPTRATAAGDGVLVVGWQFAGGQRPVVWRSRAGGDGWTAAPLPDAGRAGAAVSARCAADACAVAGRSDGVLALWRSDGAGWARVPGVPRVEVGDEDPLPPPLGDGRRWQQLVSSGGRVQLVTADAAGATARPVEGPDGAAVAAVRVGDAVYLLAGPAPDALRLWRADAAALG